MTTVANATKQSNFDEQKVAKPPIAWITFAAATLIGAFLIFQVQPVISKCVLPWFGGTPAVWTTCLLFFQVLLFAGYLYAHLIRSFLPPAVQGAVHLVLLACAACSLPIQPSDAWKPIGSASPTWDLLYLLAAHVALPYFVLSSTGPLVQAWMSYRKDDPSVYRLYALSNAGSLAALLSYPFIVEPWLSITQQSTVWSLAFGVFVLVDGWIAISLLRQRKVPSRDRLSGESAVSATPAWNTRLWWVVLPALASVMLLVITSHVCQDIAVIPFLWVAPLSLYLLTFIISFDSPNWYRPKLIAAATGLAFVVIALAGTLSPSIRMPVEAVAYLVVLFGVCLLCHGETARCQPHPRWLTQYYTLISLGGAIGGISVALVCPILFQDYRELPIAMSISMGVVVVTFLASRTWMATRCDWNISKPFAFGLTACILLSSTVSLLSRREGTIERRRNFFGVLRVEAFQGGIQLVHGSTIHGVQLAGNQNRVATSYYGEQSGIGRTIVQLQNANPSLRIGVVGLGCGVLATYGRPSDHFDMYEINPDVLSIAQEHFTFLSDCDSQIQHHVGDGRLLLERPETPKYDLLILDAFSSDAIPAHLLTLEAMRLYAEHLNPDGVLAIHLSNNHLDLVPLTHRLVQEAGMSSRSLRSRAETSTHTKPARWVIACDFLDKTSETAFWENPLLDGARAPTPKELAEAPLWTDQHHNLASVLNWSL